MKSVVLKLGIPVILVALLASLIGCSSTQAPAPPKELETVRVGHVSSVSDVPVFIAAEKGYFVEQGIKAELTNFDSAARMIPFLGSDQLDAGVGAISAGLFNAMADKVDVKIVADKGSHTSGHGYTQLVLRKDLADAGTVKTMQDLKGKTVALSAPDAVNAVQLDLMLQSVGLRLADVRIVAIPFSDMNAAFANKSIDAAMQAEPQATKGVDQALYVRLKRIDEVLPNFTGGVLLYGKSLLTSRRDTGARFMAAYLKAARVYYDAIASGKGLDEVIPIMVKYTSVKEPDLYKKMVLPGINPNGYVDEKSVLLSQEWWVKRGTVKTPVESKVIFDYEFLQKALKQLGTR